MDVEEVITCPYGEIAGFTEVGFIDTKCERNNPDMLPDCNVAFY
jgi:hypothetical protein